MRRSRRTVFLCLRAKCGRLKMKQAFSGLPCVKGSESRRLRRKTEELSEGLSKITFTILPSRLRRATLLYTRRACIPFPQRERNFSGSKQNDHFRERGEVDHIGRAQENAWSDAGTLRFSRKVSRNETSVFRAPEQLVAKRMRGPRESRISRGRGKAKSQRKGPFRRKRFRLHRLLL